MPLQEVLVLIVDDDIGILRMTRRILELEGYRVITASSGEAALNLFDSESPQLVLLDIIMPGMDGCAVCRRIREFSQTPIIMVTAKGEEEEKVEALDAGADDYVTKPFSPRELMARVRAVLRRDRLWGERPDAAFHCYGITIDFSRHSVTLDGQEVSLTATEYRLLSYLASNAGRVVASSQILETVWDTGYVGESHLLQVNIARLRQKLRDDARQPRYILTRPGIGYIMTKQT